jgi:hypothetical protein
MTKEERKHFHDAWLEAENIITLMEPNFRPEKQFKRPEDAGPEEIKLLLAFLRLAVRSFLHDKESTERENLSLTKIIDNQVTN